MYLYLFLFLIIKKKFQTLEYVNHEIPDRIRESHRIPDRIRDSHKIPDNDVIMKTQVSQVTAHLCQVILTYKSRPPQDPQSSFSHLRYIHLSHHA
jgi:hypothetical protein